MKRLTIKKPPSHMGRLCSQFLGPTGHITTVLFTLPEILKININKTNMSFSSFVIQMLVCYTHHSVPCFFQLICLSFPYQYINFSYFFLQLQNASLNLFKKFPTEEYPDSLQSFPVDCSAAVSKMYVCHSVDTQIDLQGKLPRVGQLDPRAHSFGILIAIAKLPSIWAVQIYTPTSSL